MNTSPHTRMIQPSPFAAKMLFKDGQLYQKKHKIWTFRSDQLTVSKDPSVHYREIEKLITHSYYDTYEQATIFDNRPKPIIDGKKENNLVVQFNFNIVNKNCDNRHKLDLSFMEWTFDKEYMNFLASDFANYCWFDPLKSAISQYKNSTL